MLATPPAKPLNPARLRSAVLILFDIDGTLLSTSGAGMRAMEIVGRKLFGPQFHTRAINFSGRLDPLIIMDILRQEGRPISEGAIDEFRQLYRAELPAELARSAHDARALPGVGSLLDALRAIRHDELALGLLTGNYAETGKLKLKACGVPLDAFSICVWGDESTSTPPTRDDLPRVGMEKYRADRGTALPGERVVVIGDTPHDVRCARVNGCRSLAVATGHHPIDELVRSGADRAVPTLEDTDGLVKWLFERD